MKTVSVTAEHLSMMRPVAALNLLAVAVIYSTSR